MTVEPFPEYTKSVVSLIDILGFSNLIQQPYFQSLPKAIGFLETFKTSSQYVFLSGSNINSEPVTIKYFSDLVLRRRSRSHPDKHDLVMAEIWDLATIAAKLVTDRLIVRGAIVYGDHYQSRDEELVVSPAFIEAHRYESKICASPRIIIAPEAIDLLKMHLKQEKLSMFHDYFKNLVRLDVDGYYFVDYLKGYLHTYAGKYTDEQHFSLMEDHQGLVKRGLDEFKADSPVLAKYIWLGNYHNNVIHEKVFGDKFKKLEIAPELLIQR